MIVLCLLLSTVNLYVLCEMQPPRRLKDFMRMLNLPPSLIYDNIICTHITRIL
jgi:hypothetical protein